MVDNIDQAMTSYGLKRVRNESHTIDSDDPANKDVILFYWSSHTQSRYNMCIGSKCDEMYRVILQTEQMFRRRRPLETCHHSYPNCVIWDFSDFNLRYFQESGISDSVLLVPHMFQNRLDGKLPSAFKSSKDRDIDAVLLGSMSRRRIEFKAEYILDFHDINGTIHHDYNNSTLSSQNIVFEHRKK